MTDISEYLANGGQIHYLPEMPAIKHFTGNIKQELIRQLQAGAKTFDELRYLGDRKTIKNACNSIKREGSPIAIVKDVINLEAAPVKVLKVNKHDFDAKQIGEFVGRYYLKNNHLLTLNNFYWTGYECDLFCITRSLKPIEFEIKISRNDFFMDAKKDKWQQLPSAWKHYYIMPKAIYSEDLIERLPHPNCGILTVEVQNGIMKLQQQKPAVANRNVKSVKSQVILNVARLANQRYWKH